MDKLISCELPYDDMMQQLTDRMVNLLKENLLQIVEASDDTTTRMLLYEGTRLKSLETDQLFDRWRRHCARAFFEQHADVDIVIIQLPTMLRRVVFKRDLPPPV